MPKVSFGRIVLIALFVVIVLPLLSMIFPEGGSRYGGTIANIGFVLFFAAFIVYIVALLSRTDPAGVLLRRRAAFATFGFLWLCFAGIRLDPANKKPDVGAKPPQASVKHNASNKAKPVTAPPKPGAGDSQPMEVTPAPTPEDAVTALRAYVDGTHDKETTKSPSGDGTYTLLWMPPRDLDASVLFVTRTKGSESSSWTAHLEGASLPLEEYTGVSPMDMVFYERDGASAWRGIPSGPFAECYVQEVGSSDKTINIFSGDYLLGTQPERYYRYRSMYR